MTTKKKAAAVKYKIGKCQECGKKVPADEDSDIMPGFIRLFCDKCDNGYCDSIYINTNKKMEKGLKEITKLLNKLFPNNPPQ